MPRQVVDLRKKTKQTKGWWRKEYLIALVAVVLATAGLRAADVMIGKNSQVDSRCPQDMVAVSSASGEFCIDKYEASAGGDCKFSKPVNQNETRQNLDQEKCKPVSIVSAMPWINISRDQAENACAKAGKRLPSNKEWQQAALGTPDKSDGWLSEDCQVASNWSSQPGLTGSGSKCQSPLGIYDMIGNVWEWVSGSVSNGEFDGHKLPITGYIDEMSELGLPDITNENLSNENYNKDYFWVKENDVRGIARGGYWDNKSDAGQYSVYAVSQPSTVGQGIGFRCAK